MRHFIVDAREGSEARYLDSVIVASDNVRVELRLTQNIVLL